MNRSEHPFCAFLRLNLDMNISRILPLAGVLGIFLAIAPDSSAFQSSQAQSRHLTVTPQPLPALTPANAATPASSEPQPTELTFTGEATLGKTFEREIGYGLLFRLVPTVGDEDSGWNIAIVPKSGAPDDEFVGIATPPYHFYNPRYLDTSYATSAKDAVAFNPRPFNFVLTHADSEVAGEYVNMTIYPNHATKEDFDEIDQKASKVEIGTGELHILDSRITPGDSEKETGKIDWIKFEVKLKFHSGMNMTDVLDPYTSVSK
jgi:hypothetical protein